MGMGRRRSLMIGNILYCIGSVISAVMPYSQPWMLFFGQTVYGLGVGFTMHGAPLYIAETATPRLRGRLVSMKEAFIVLGMLIGYGAGAIFTRTPAGWRYMLIIPAPISLLLLCALFFLPMSPR